MHMTKNDIVLEARKWLGTPFRHQGRLMGVGVDCIGVLVQVSIALKLCPEYPDTKEYGRIPIGDMVQNKLDEFLVPIRREDIQSGDVGLFKFNKDPQHIGIFTDIGIIHAYSTVGQCVEHSFTDPWPSRMLQAYCFKELL